MYWRCWKGDGERTDVVAWLAVETQDVTAAFETALDVDAGERLIGEKPLQAGDVLVRFKEIVTNDVDAANALAVVGEGQGREDVAGMSHVRGRTET